MNRKVRPDELNQLYDDGLQGWIWNEEVKETWSEFCAEEPDLYAVNASIEGLHEKRPRVLLYLAREKYDPGAFTKEAQQGPDCTSHGDRTAKDISRCVEINNGDSEVYYKRSATEPCYGARGSSGDGMDPTRAAKFSKEVGFLFREPYSDSSNGVSLDLTKYNFNIGDNWGRTGTPENIKAICRKHNVGQTLVPKSVEQALDCMAAGKAGHSGQRWGTPSRQNKDGINRLGPKRWNHDMAHGGYDLTEEFFKEQVAFVHNSWGPDWLEPNPIWLEHEDVYGPWIPGTIVVPLDEFEDFFVNTGSIHYYSDVKGFPISEIPYTRSGVL